MREEIYSNYGLFRDINIFELNSAYAVDIEEF
jgi:hypothetical protein